jgi:hypothetical protein
MQTLILTKNKGLQLAVPRTLPQDQGWKKASGPHGVTQYIGFYRVRGLAYHGVIYQKGDRLQFLIFEPPEDFMRQSGHYGCFHYYADHFSFVNMNPPPQDIGAGIVAIQRTLEQGMINSARGLSGKR